MWVGLDKRVMCLTACAMTNLVRTWVNLGAVMVRGARFDTDLSNEAEAGLIRSLFLKLRSTRCGSLLESGPSDVLDRLAVEYMTFGPIV